MASLLMVTTLISTVTCLSFPQVSFWSVPPGVEQLRGPEAHLSPRLSTPLSPRLTVNVSILLSSRKHDSPQSSKFISDSSRAANFN